MPALPAGEHEHAFLDRRGDRFECGDDARGSEGGPQFVRIRVGHADLARPARMTGTPTRFNANALAHSSVCTATAVVAPTMSASLPAAASRPSASSSSPPVGGVGQTRAVQQFLASRS